MIDFYDKNDLIALLKERNDIYGELSNEDNAHIGKLQLNNNGTISFIIINVANEQLSDINFIIINIYQNNYVLIRPYPISTGSLLTDNMYSMTLDKTTGTNKLSQRYKLELFSLDKDIVI